MDLFIYIYNLHDDNDGYADNENVTHHRRKGKSTKILQQSQNTGEEEINDSPYPLLSKELHTPLLPVHTREKHVPGDLMVHSNLHKLPHRRQQFHTL